MTEQNPLKLASTRRTLYVGQVERSRVGGGRIRLIAARSIEGFWIPEPPREFIKIPWLNHDYDNKQIVFLELDSRREITQLKEGDTELIEFLNHLASSVDKLAEEKNHIREWRESLEFQSDALMKRSEALAVREVELELMSQAISSDSKA